MIHVHVKLGPDITGDELDVTVDYSDQARAYHVNVWGGPMVDVSRGDLTALRDKLTEVLDSTPDLPA
jgi:hypothetical protein